MQGNVMLYFKPGKQMRMKYITLCFFFFYKNLFYKNVEAEINQNFKNVF